MFDRIKLYTRDGGYVVTVLVPHFNPQAEAILWGARVFILKPDGRYVEGLLWHADVNKQYEEAETQVDSGLAQALESEAQGKSFDEVKASLEEPGSKSSLEGEFDYGRLRPDGQFERHPTIPVPEGTEYARPLRHSYQHKKCGGVTTMGASIAKTYAVRPDYYDGTYCSKCQGYFQFNSPGGEFVWIDESTKQPTEDVVGK